MYDNVNSSEKMKVKKKFKVLISFPSVGRKRIVKSACDDLVKNKVIILIFF